MATVRGLTAERMLEIENETIVDGNIVGENLILITRDGTEINAGVVRGAPGPTGPAGLDLTTISTKTVLDVGIANQVRAGRQLTLADFNTLCGLPTVPAGLFNLSDLTNLGSGGPLINKGAVPFGPGVTGAAAEAAYFADSTAQALYIADTGAGDPFRLLTGSFGCWFRSPRRGATQRLFGKWAAAARNWTIVLLSTNVVQVEGQVSAADVAAGGVTDVCDDKWHFAVGTYDGTAMRLYVDGVLEATAYSTGVLTVGTAPLNIGGREASGATAAIEPAFGPIDEAFVTQDVLSAEQVRLLYCTKIAHGYDIVPKHVILNVNRRRRGPKLAVADFPAQPVRLYNLEDLFDLGSNNVPLTANPGTGAIVQVPGPDGSKNTARSYSGAHTGDSGTDAGLPAGTAARSYGIWFKTTYLAANHVLISWGTVGTGDARTFITMGGLLSVNSGADSINSQVVTDGQWHHLVVVEDNAAAAVLRRKAYVDGRLVSFSGVLNSIVLAGANRFRIGANQDGTSPFVGQLARAFVYAGALTPMQITALYAKGAQALGVSPKNPGDHIEALDASSIYATFDSLEPQHQVDMAVAV